MKDWIRDYFTFTRSEQRGLIVLLSLLLLSILFSLLSPIFVKEKSYDMSQFREQVEAFLLDTCSGDQKIPEDDSGHPDLKKSDNERQQGFIGPPFTFNPNELDEAGWARTGLQSWMIRNILKYREKGGVFRSKEDLKKIYGMSDPVFLFLEPYIVIQERPVTEQLPIPGRTSKTGNEPVIDSLPHSPARIELNSADSARLTALPGIGPAFASRIIKYRVMLGGFTDIDQLLEVRGMDSSRYLGIRDKIVADADLVLKMDLNSVSFKEMLKHPYFEYYIVKDIFNLKARVGEIDSVGQLREIGNMYPELYDKLSPYLQVNLKTRNE